MATAKVRNLMARPSQTAHLCFEVDGILGEMSAQLGAPITPFDFSAFYGRLGDTVPKTSGGYPARLLYDSGGIQSDADVKKSLLCALRAESAKAALDIAVDARQSAYYKKYGNQAAIIAQIRQNYDASVGGAASKPARLNSLVNISAAQANALDAAYMADGRTGVVKSTTNSLNSTTTSEGTSNSSSNGSVQGASDTTTNSQSATNQQTLQNPANASDLPAGFLGPTPNGDIQITAELGFINEVGNYVVVNQPGWSWQAKNFSAPTTATSSGTSSGSGTNNQTSVGSSQTNSTGESSQVQATTNTDYGYRVPSAENQAQFQRTQISLMDEQFAQFMYAQRLDYLESLFGIELRDMDLGVKRLQVAYLNTILLSPIEGVVTGLFKNLGDRVKAGESVVRVENNSSVYLVGTLICRGSVSLGNNVQVTTTLFESSAPITITGSIVAVRGHKSEDGWDVVVSCSNPLDSSTGLPILPLNYHFDFDDTTVTIS